MNLPKANVMRALCARYDMIAGEEKRCRKATHNDAKHLITHNLPQAIIVGCHKGIIAKISPLETQRRIFLLAISP